MTNASDGDEADASSKTVEQAREEVIQAMVRSAEMYSAKQSYGRLYGILFFADAPMSLDDLAERSGYAKSTVSTAMKTLERFYLVNRLSIPGEGKKAFYEVEDDLDYVVRRFLEDRIAREIDIMTSSLERAEQRLEGEDGETARHHLEKTRELRETYEYGERLLRFLIEDSPDVDTQFWDEED